MTHKGRFRKVLKTFKLFHNDNILEVILDRHSGFKCEITKDHKVLAIKRRKGYYKTSNHLKIMPQWYKISELKPKDFICFPKLKSKSRFFDLLPMRLYNKRTKVISNLSLMDFVQLGGIYLAEGCISKKEIIFSLRGDGDYEIKKKLKLFCNSYGLNLHERLLKGNRCNFVISSVYLCDLFEYYFGKYSHFKNIKREILELPEEYLSQLLKYAWLGDGYISEKESCYTTVSENLALNIKEILIKLDIFPSVKYLENRLSYDIRLSGIKENNKFKILIDNNNIINLPQKESNRYFEDNDYYYFNIRSIKEKKIDDNFVYNLNVKDDNSYVCHHWIVKNSGEGYGLLMAEAMACGKPISHCSYTTPPELLDEQYPGIGKRGLLVNYDVVDNAGYNTEHALVSIKDLSEKILIYYNDRNLMKEHGENGRKFAEKYLSWRIILEQWKEFFIKNV